MRSFYSELDGREGDLSSSFVSNEKVCTFQACFKPRLMGSFVNGFQKESDDDRLKEKMAIGS
ncbi:hypothetical protein A0Q29_15425, partial [Salmonella enterica]|nr:hypothetical protein [Salmonella enterica]